LFEDLQASPPTWPKSGTWELGAAYEHPMSAPVTAGNGSSSSPGLLKTPTAQLAVNGGSQHPDKRRAGGHGPTLADQVEHLLPTPGAMDYKGSGYTQGRQRDGRPRPQGDMDLPEAVLLLPTPRATDGTHGGPNMRGSKGELMLPSAVILLPTPMVGDAKMARNSTATRHRTPPTGIHPGDTLTDILVPRTGESTPSPSDAGSESSDGQLLLPLSLDEPASA
jgi:hypothetical protein